MPRINSHFNLEPSNYNTNQGKNAGALAPKKNRLPTWVKPVAYTALTVAGIAAVYFAVSGISPPQPPLNEISPEKMDDLLKMNAFLKAIAPMSTLREVESYLRRMDPKTLPNSIFQNATLDIGVGMAIASEYWDSQRQDCPDLTKVCPVPTRLCKMDKKVEPYETLNCADINRYVLRILKEDCPSWIACKGKYCSWNGTSAG